jgi:hypothetical protein
MKRLILTSLILLSACTANNVKNNDIEIKPIGVEIKKQVINSEVLPHIKEQENLIALLHKELGKLKTKSKCGDYSDTCIASQQDDPMQRMDENDACVALLDERRKYLLKNCLK